MGIFKAERYCFGDISYDRCSQLRARHFDFCDVRVDEESEEHVPSKDKLGIKRCKTIKTLKLSSMIYVLVVHV